MEIKDLFVNLRNFNNYKGEYGIEIETETKSAYDHPEFFFWRTHGDGSLRDYGVEYILKQPIGYREIQDALKEFDEKTKHLAFIKDSFSTSVHAHVNMLNESITTMGNFMTLYFLFENLLIRYSGPNRRSNLFCLPTIDAEETFMWARSMFEAIQQKDYRRLVLPENQAKYAALNLSALGKYGSLELRSFRGETDTKIISDWFGIIHSILQYARQKHNPKMIMESFKDKGMKLRDEVFGDYAKLLTWPDDEKLVETNVFYAGSIAYSVKSWEDLDKKEVKKFSPTKRQLDEYSNAIFGKSFENVGGGEQQHILAVMEKDHMMGKLSSSRKRKSVAPELQVAWNNIQALNNPAAEILIGDAA